MHRTLADASAFDRDVEETPGLRSLKPAAIWRFLKKQPPSFWFVSTYLFFEYVRPQQIYERHPRATLPKDRDPSGLRVVPHGKAAIPIRSA